MRREKPPSRALVEDRALRHLPRGEYRCAKFVADIVNGERTHGVDGARIDRDHEADGSFLVIECWRRVDACHHVPEIVELAGDGLPMRGQGLAARTVAGVKC